MSIPYQTIYSRVLGVIVLIDPGREIWLIISAAHGDTHFSFLRTDDSIAILETLYKGDNALSTKPVHNALSGHSLSLLLGGVPVNPRC